MQQSSPTELKVPQFGIATYVAYEGCKEGWMSKRSVSKLLNKQWPAMPQVSHAGKSYRSTKKVECQTDLSPEGATRLVRDAARVLCRHKLPQDVNLVGLL